MVMMRLRYERMTGKVARGKAPLCVLSGRRAVVSLKLRTSPLEIKGNILYLWPEAIKTKKFRKGISMRQIKCEGLSEGLAKMFATPSLMNGEEEQVYHELYGLVEAATQPKDIWDQMLVSDVVCHFWEQRRLRLNQPTTGLRTDPACYDWAYPPRGKKSC